MASLPSEPMVATIEALGNCDLLLPCLFNMDPILVVGPEGCGKNLTLRCFCYTLVSNTILGIAFPNSNQQALLPYTAVLKLTHVTLYKN